MSQLTTHEAKQMRLLSIRLRAAKSKKRRDRAIRYYDNGLTLEQIADKLKVSTRQVRRYLKGILVSKYPKQNQ